MQEKLVYIADDHEIVSQGIQDFLSHHFTKIQAFNSGTELIRQLKTNCPDFLILDLNIPGSNGLEVLKYIQDESLSVVTVILTMYNEISLIEKCKKMGAHGYLLKTSTNEDVLEALFAPKFTYGKGVKNAAYHEEFKDSFVQVSTLTPREIEIIRLLSQDYGSEEIADKLNVSLHTVNTHRRNLKKKLDVSTTAGIIAFGYKNKLILD